MKKNIKLLVLLSVLLVFVLLTGFFLKQYAAGQRFNLKTSTENPGDGTSSREEVVTKAPVKASDFVIPQKGGDLKGYTIILHTNDTHGRVSPDTSRGQMGFAAVSALKKCYEEAGAKVILLDAGDTLHGTKFAQSKSGKQIVSLMNLIGYDAMAPGNNDFNYGTGTLVKRAKKMDFPLLSANISYKKSGKAMLKDHIIITKNGVKYGIFGLTTTDTVTREDPKDTHKVEFNDPIQSAKKQVAELKKEGAGVIIALAHMGMDDSSEFTSKEIAEDVDGINLIVDGHSHVALDHGCKVHNTLIVNTGCYLTNIGVVTISPDGSMKAQLVNASEFNRTDSVVDDYIKKHSK